MTAAIPQLLHKQSHPDNRFSFTLLFDSQRKTMPVTARGEGVTLYFAQRATRKLASECYRYANKPKVAWKMFSEGHGFTWGLSERRKRQALVNAGRNDNGPVGGGWKLSAPFLLKLSGMNTQNIRREIGMLSPSEVSELQVWLNEQEQDEAKVDLQLKYAVESGNFDDLINEAVEDEKAGLTTPL